MHARVDPVTKPRPVRGFVVSTGGRSAWRACKVALYALLIGNVGLYALHGTPAEVVDTAAWVVLLLLFEWETGGWRLAPRMRLVVHAVRGVAAIAVVGACISYALAHEWLDFANASAWFGVIALLEAEVRVPVQRVAFHRMRSALTWLLYAALAGFVVAWAMQGVRGVDGALLDAWDAALWLLAFVAIELNVFGFETRR